MMDYIRLVFSIGLGVAAIPFIVFFSVKWGTVAFYKAKQFIDKQKTGDQQNE